MSNSFGTLFKITTFGESHGEAIGVIIDGCPPHITITESDIQTELDRRKPGQSNITTPRKESDKIEILSGIFKGKTTGTPIAIIIKNKDANSKAYDHLKNIYRPSHADFTYEKKYGIRDYRGGGRSSARETAARVAAGAIAKKILHLKYKINCLAYVTQIHAIKATNIPKKVSLTQIEKNIIRCPDQKTAKKMIEAIEKARKEGNSLGGIIRGLVKNVPAGIGEPIFNKLKAALGHAMLSIPATMGFQIGSGFESVNKTGIEHNDAFIQTNDAIQTKTNFSGGIQGGISNGQDIYFDIAFKPTATINKAQKTVNQQGESVVLKAKGRHDPCVLPRAVPIVESMSALTILDQIMLQECKIGK